MRGRPGGPRDPAGGAGSRRRRLHPADAHLKEGSAIAQQRVRINEQIHFSPVRLIDSDGNQLGIVPLEQAQAEALKSNLDLVEISPDSRPIVCKIMDWGKYRYDEAKKAREARKHQITIEVKEVKYRPAIDDHDFQTKTNRARDFLTEGKKVKVTVMFRGRDMRRPENGFRILDRVAEDLKDVGQVTDRPGKIIGRDLAMTLSPLATAKKPPKKAGAPASPAS